MSGRYWRSVLIGGGLVVASTTTSTWALYEILRIGTCASGGPYVSARPCPPGTGWAIFGLIVSIFAILIGAAILSPRKVERRSKASTGLLVWGLGFVMPCVGIVVSIWGPAANGRDDSMLGGIIVLAVFGLMGLPPLVFTLRSLFRFEGDGGRVALATDEIRKLDQLRDSGLLTDEEFEAAKQRVLKRH